MIKLIATDMDGTFLDSSKRFSMEFFDIFAETKGPLSGNADHMDRIPTAVCLSVESLVCQIFRSF